MTETITLPLSLVVSALTALALGAAWLIKTLVMQHTLKAELKTNVRGMKAVVRDLEQQTGTPSMLPPANDEEEDMRTHPAIILTPKLLSRIDQLTKQFLEEQNAAELAREQNRGRSLEPTDITPRETVSGRERVRRWTPPLGFREDHEITPTDPIGIARPGSPKKKR